MKFVDSCVLILISRTKMSTTVLLSLWLVSEIRSIAWGDFMEGIITGEEGLLHVKTDRKRALMSPNSIEYEWVDYSAISFCTKNHCNYGISGAKCSSRKFINC